MDEVVIDEVAIDDDMSDEVVLDDSMMDKVALGGNVRGEMALGGNVRDEIAPSSTSSSTMLPSSATSSITLPPGRSKICISEDQQKDFYASLNLAKVKPAILKIVQPYAQAFVPTATLSTYPKPISDLYDPSTLQLNYRDLLAVCDKVYDSYEVDINIAIE